jgi:hypothetical protein
MGFFLLCAQVYGYTSKWKIFSNRAGWTIKYPADWKTASCHSCPDPTAPDVFVDFLPPRDTDSGWVMISHLEMEDVYVVSDSQTFSISFGGDKPGIALAEYGNYPIYLEMVGSFKVKR